MLKMGIRLFKNLFSGPATRLKSREPFERQRGYIDIDIDKCIFCGKCSRECPSGCIDVDRKTYTWKFNPYECIICGVCVDTCPKNAICMNKNYRTPSVTKAIKLYHGKPPVRPSKQVNPAAEKTDKHLENDNKKNEVA